MRNIVFIICLGFMSFTTLAQTQATVTASSTAPLDSLTKLAQQFINNNQADSLYALMGDAFKQQVSRTKLQEVMGQLTSQLGKWTTTESRGIQDGIARYKAIFAIAPLDFYISRNKQGKVETFLFKPLE